MSQQKKLQSMQGGGILTNISSERNDYPYVQECNLLSLENLYTPFNANTNTLFTFFVQVKRRRRCVLIAKQE
jgi:hypothetical protein